MLAFWADSVCCNRIGAAWLLIAAERGSSAVSCRNETFLIVEPDTTTWTCTTPYWVWIAGPAIVRVDAAGARLGAVDEAPDDGADDGPDDGAPADGADDGADGAADDGALLGNEAAGRPPRPARPVCDLKLSKAVSPATVPTRASRMRFT